MGHLFSLIFQSEGLITSIFRVVSLFNNLFILLFLPYLGYFEFIKEQKNTLNIIIVFLVIMMFLSVFQGVSFHNIEIGVYTLLWVDTALSLFAIYFLGKGIYKNFLEIFPENKIFSFLTLFSTFSLAFVIIISFLLNQFQLYKIAFVYQNFYFTYILQYSSIFFFMISFILLSLHWEKNLDKIQDEKIEEAEKITELTPKEEEKVVLEAILPPAEMEILPESLTLDFDAVKQCFILNLVCNQKSYAWTGENCIYPFFYWVYISLAMKQNVQVSIKDAQVNRNKMVSLFSKELKPKNFILLNGEEAVLNISKDKIHFGNNLFSHPAVKAKFKEQIKPFLFLAEYDAARYKAEIQYADTIFNEIYRKIIEN